MLNGRLIAICSDLQTQVMMSNQLPADWWILVFAALLVGGVLAAGFASRLRLPGLLLFLALGMVIGDDGLGVVSLGESSARFP